jgi:anti-anti-sigma regulatory factor
MTMNNLQYPENELAAPDMVDEDEAQRAHLTNGEPENQPEEDTAEKQRHVKVFRTVALASAGSAVMLLLSYIGMGLLGPQFPVQYVVPNTATFVVMALFSFWLNRQGHLSWAVGVYLASLTLALLIGMYLVNGIGGPITIALLLTVVVAGLIGGTIASRLTAVSIAILYLAMAALEMFEVLHPWQVSGTTLWVSEVGMFLAVLLVVTLSISGFRDLVQRALQQLRERKTELRESIVEREQLQQRIIETQQQALKELLTPIIPVTDHIIVMPLIGSIDSMRARDITRSLLAGISEHRAKVVILDVTGVSLMDTGIVNHLNKTIQAARLKGAHTIVTGISDAVAESIVDLGIDWSEITTLSDLQSGLMVALDKLGFKLNKES